MTRRPDAIFVLDTKKESIAVTEANKLGIPVVAVVDTNVDPELVQYPIPGNDDAIRSAALLTKVVAEAAAAGLIARAGARNGAPEGEDKPQPVGSNEPLPEWEQELLTGANATAGGGGQAAVTETPAES